MRLTRRRFLEVAAVVGSGAVAGRAEASPREDGAADDVAAVLVDTTRCLGCRSCEVACAEAKGLPEPERLGDEGVFDEPRTTSTTQFTIVRRASPAAEADEPRYAKRQCMHCLAPACASACPVRALEKKPEGPVVYHPERCMGCRYCMVSCPFDVPKYEYQRAVPYVRKCDFCAPRLARGEKPACVEACPTGALVFGRRGALLEEAKRRIWTAPDRYVHAVYGEREAGGTGWLYLSDRPFEAVGLPSDVGERPYPELPATALGSVPVILTLGPPILLALHAFSKRRDAVARRAEGEGAYDV